MKFYSREIWKSVNYDFKNKKCRLIRIREYLATSDVSMYNCRKRNKFIETNYAYDFFMSHDYLEEDKIYHQELFRIF